MHDQIVLQGLGGHRTASKFNGMRGVVVETKSCYLKKGMYTVLVLPESGEKAQALTVKQKYLKAFSGGDDSSVIIESSICPPKTEKLFGMPLKTSAALRGALKAMAFQVATNGGWYWPSPDHDPAWGFEGWHIELRLDGGEVTYMGITNGRKDGTNIDIYKNGDFVPGGYPAGWPKSGAAYTIWAKAAQALNSIEVGRPDGWH